MRILLVNPPSGRLTMGLKHLSRVEPLGLEILGAAVPQHDVALLDMEIDTNLASALKRHRPDIVGVTAQVVQSYSALDVVRAVKAFNPETLTLLGGHHATLCPEEFNVPEIDAIVLGEGVPALREIVAAWSEGDQDLSRITGLAIPHGGDLVRTPPRPIPQTLDHQPQPNRTLTSKYRSKYFYLFQTSVASIQTSMGCSFGCTFCSCQRFSQRHFVPRSAELVVADLCQIEEDFVIFCDDHSFLDPKRMEDLHDLILERGVHKQYFAYTRADCVVENPELFAKWAKIGLVLIMTGLEALDDAAIDAVKKGTSLSINEQALTILAECGIGVSAGFLVRPDFKESDFERIDQFVEAHPIIVMSELTPLTPLPGTLLYAEQADTVTSENRELYDLAHFVVPTELPAHEIYTLMRKYYRRIVWRSIRRLGLFRPRAALRPHMLRLALGAVRVDFMLRGAHKWIDAPVPGEP